MSKLLCAVVSLTPLLIGCADVNSAPKEEKMAAMTAYVDCLVRVSKQFDDGVSDADVVALGITPLCSAAFSGVIEVGGRGMNPAAFSLFRQKMLYDQRKLATGVVLKVRSLKTQNKTN